MTSKKQANLCITDSLYWESILDSPHKGPAMWKPFAWHHVITHSHISRKDPASVEHRNASIPTEARPGHVQSRNARLHRDMLGRGPGLSAPYCGCSGRYEENFKVSHCSDVTCRQNHRQQEQYNTILHTKTKTTQITKFMGPTWGPPGSCRPPDGPHVGSMNLAIRAVTLAWIRSLYLVWNIPETCQVRCTKDERPWDISTSLN